MTKVITVKVSKGGVGKTTITTNLSHYFAKQGKKILVIDLDAQANLSKTFIREFDSNKLTSSNFIAEDFSHINNYKYDIDKNLHLISADIGLNEASKYVESTKKYHNRIKNLMQHKQIQRYDYVFFDLSPGVSDTLTQMALIGSDLLLCPTHFDIDSLTGLILTIEEISNLYESNLISENLNYLVVPNRYDKRFDKDNKIIINLLYENLEKEFIAEPIRENSHIKKARMIGKSAIEYEEHPDRKYEHKKAIEDFKKLATKIEKII